MSDGIQDARKLDDRDRLFDLVRYCRHQLHEDNLISNEEFARLVEQGSSHGEGSVARLSTYDEMRRRLNFLVGTDPSWCPEGHERRFGADAREGDDGTYDECQICRAVKAEELAKTLVQTIDKMTAAFKTLMDKTETLVQTVETFKKAYGVK